VAQNEVTNRELDALEASLQEAYHDGTADAFCLYLYGLVLADRCAIAALEAKVLQPQESNVQCPPPKPVGLLCGGCLVAAALFHQLPEEPWLTRARGAQPAGSARTMRARCCWPASRPTHVTGPHGR
jgi:hypothetical protein